MEKIKIMLVEDDEQMAQSVQLCLQNLGYEISSIATTGEEALTSAAKNNPDLILMDIILKGAMSGVDAANKIYEKNKIPILYLTACTDDKTLEEIKMSSTFGYIMKPFREQELRMAIEMAIYKHKTSIALKNKDQLLSTTLKSIGDGVIAADQNGTITFINKQACKITGWDQQEATGKKLTEIFTLYDEDTRLEYEAIIAQTRVNSSNTPVPIQNSLRTKSKETIAIENNIAQIIDDHGNKTGIVLTFRDISLRKELEEELRQSQKMEAVGRLAGGVAHDFNNLLTAIIGYSDLVINITDAQENGHTESVLIKKAAEKAAELTDQLLAFSRRQTAQPKIINLNNLVSNMQKLLLHAIGENTAFSTELQPDLIPIKADSGQIQQVILNIVINAKDAMSKGGKLTIKTFNTSHNAKFNPPSKPLPNGNYAALSITDTGCGMTKEVATHIFEPFFTTKKKGERSGLGLSTVYGIIMQCNGHIDVTTAPNEGTTIFIYLPQAIEKNKTETKRQIENQNSAQEQTILLVEDEEMVRSLAEAVLSRKGYNIISAESGNQALKIIESHNGKISLLITDMVMPGISGYELAEKMQELHPETKLMFMSGYSEQVDEKPFPVSSFLQKPFTLDQLTDKVAQAINED